MRGPFAQAEAGGGGWSLVTFGGMEQRHDIEKTMETGVRQSEQGATDVDRGKVEKTYCGSL